ncbi:MAG: nucleotide pyrophosphohydrolase [Saprospiraceae bacterium]
MSDIETITKAILQFRDERDWAQFHTGRDLATLLNVEAGELLELFLWKKQNEDPDQEKLKDELADVFYAAFLLAAHYQLDVPTIIMEKLEQNRRKYPVEKARGRREKYDEL